MMRRGEHGSVSVFVTTFAVALIFVAGLVLDGGALLAARRSAANIAESAARAGAQELDELAARGAGRTALDVERAQQRAVAFLAANGYGGTAVATADAVTVEATTRQDLQILGLGGLGSVSVRATGRAEPVRAIAGDDT